MRRQSASPVARSAGGWRGGAACRAVAGLPRRAGGAAAGAVLVDDGEQFADLDVLAFLARDAGDDAALLGADLEVDLLGFELDERVADLDAIAFLLQPPRDARLDDRFSELRDDDVGHGGRQRFDPVRLRAGFERTIGDSVAWLSRSNARSTSAF